jgi:hypothetical protein
MRGDSFERFAPLTGVAFVVIVLIGFLIGGDTPGAHASAARADSFYDKHHDAQTIAAFVVALGAAFLPFFASSLKRALDWSGGTGRLANAAFGGGVIAASGFLVLSTIHLALADAAGKTSPQVTQALNVLDNNDFIPMAAGLGVLLIASGLAIVRYRALPGWLGWAGLVIGILIFTPAGFIAFLLSGIWVLITSVVLFRRSGAAPPADAGPLPA